jgi:hypothetical protein
MSHRRRLVGIGMRVLGGSRCLWHLVVDCLLRGICRVRMRVLRKRNDRLRSLLLRNVWMVHWLHSSHAGVLHRSSLRLIVDRRLPLRYRMVVAWMRSRGRCRKVLRLKRWCRWHQSIRIRCLRHQLHRLMVPLCKGSTSAHRRRHLLARRRLLLYHSKWKRWCHLLHHFEVGCKIFFRIICCNVGVLEFKE